MIPHVPRERVFDEVAILNMAADKTTRVSWQQRYAHRHAFVRVTGDPALPNGRRGRVTIYRRGHEESSSGSSTFILSWCTDGKHKKERVVGDKFDAVRRADEINSQIAAGAVSSTVQAEPETLLREYVAHLERRADAGQVAPNTPARYRSALTYWVNFVGQDGTCRSCHGWAPVRDSALRFQAFLQGRLIAPNGHPNAKRRPLSMKGIDFILAGTRAMIRWGVREGLLRPGAADGFIAAGRNRPPTRVLSLPPITTDALIRLVQAADLYQLVLFSFHIFHGVRVAEPCWLMAEFFDAAEGWIDYRCIEELGYRTKGAVDKRLPVPHPMARGLSALLNGRTGGPLLRKRRFVERQSNARRSVSDLAQIVERVQRFSPSSWSERFRMAATHLKQSGATDGDDIRREFSRLARTAGIQSDVTPKALRHHFATALERADVPYYTRKYLLGHRLGGRGGRGADITAIYTHLEPDFIKGAYQRVLDGPLANVLTAFSSRLDQLSGDLSRESTLVGVLQENSGRGSSRRSTYLNI